MNKYADLLRKAVAKLDELGAGEDLADEMEAAAAEMEQAEPAAWEVDYRDGYRHLCKRMDDAMCLADNDPLHRVVTPLYRHPAPVAPAVPERITAYDVTRPVQSAVDYSIGWNDCREAMLSASPEPESSKCKHGEWRHLPCVLCDSEIIDAAMKEAK